jgi:hypothetical protein
LRFTARGKYGGISLLPGDQVDLSKLTTSEADVLRTMGLDVDRAADADGRPRMFALSCLEGWDVLDEPRYLRPGATLTDVAGELSQALESRHRVTITVGYDELDGVRQLLQFSSHIEVLHPEAARRLIYELAQQIVPAHR